MFVYQKEITVLKSDVHFKRNTYVLSAVKAQLTRMLYFSQNQVSNYFLENLPSGVTNYTLETIIERHCVVVAQFRVDFAVCSLLETELYLLGTSSSFFLVYKAF